MAFSWKRRALARMPPSRGTTIAVSRAPPLDAGGGSEPPAPSAVQRGYVSAHPQAKEQPMPPSAPYADARAFSACAASGRTDLGGIARPSAPEPDGPRCPPFRRRKADAPAPLPRPFGGPLPLPDPPHRPHRLPRGCRDALPRVGSATAERAARLPPGEGLHGDRVALVLTRKPCAAGRTRVRKHGSARGLGERYAPSRVEQLLPGNADAVRALRTWMAGRRAADPGSPRAAFVHGPTGCGKSSLVRACLAAEGYRWNVIDAAALQRSRSLTEEITERVGHMLLGPTGVIVEDVDAVLAVVQHCARSDGRSEGSAACAASDTSADASTDTGDPSLERWEIGPLLQALGSYGPACPPVVFLCTNRSPRQLRELERVCLSVRVEAPDVSALGWLAAAIAERERIDLDPDTRDALAGEAAGDIRRLLHALDMLRAASPPGVAVEGRSTPRVGCQPPCRETSVDADGRGACPGAIADADTDPHPDPDSEAVTGSDAIPQPPRVPRPSVGAAEAGDAIGRCARETAFARSRRGDLFPAHMFEATRMLLYGSAASRGSAGCATERPLRLDEAMDVFSLDPPLMVDMLAHNYLSAFAGVPDRRPPRGEGVDPPGRPSPPPLDRLRAIAETAEAFSLADALGTLAWPDVHAPAVAAIVSRAACCAATRLDPSFPMGRDRRVEFSHRLKALSATKADAQRRTCLRRRLARLLGPFPPQELGGICRLLLRLAVSAAGPPSPGPATAVLPSIDRVSARESRAAAADDGQEVGRVGDAVRDGARFGLLVRSLRRCRLEARHIQDLREAAGMISRGAGTSAGSSRATVVDDREEAVARSLSERLERPAEAARPRSDPRRTPSSAARRRAAASPPRPGRAAPPAFVAASVPVRAHGTAHRGRGEGRRAAAGRGCPTAGLAAGAQFRSESASRKRRAPARNAERGGESGRNRGRARGRGRECGRGREPAAKRAKLLHALRTQRALE